LLSLDVEGVAVLPVSLGRGFIKGDHGIYPAPGPATVAILKESGLSVRIGTEDEGELCTPTGAALLSEFSTMSPPAGAYTLIGIGYGAGTRDPPGIPNVLRAMLVEIPSAFGHDTVDVLETNVDDVSGEVIAYTMGRLMDAGARDVSAIPSVMKKGRSGHLIRVICRAEDAVRLAEILAAELGTFGIRCTTQVHRLIAERSFERVSVTIGGRRVSVEVKCSWKDGKVAALKAEYEQAKTIAGELGIPLRDVIRSVEEEAWRQCTHRNGR
jgi:uncharacterized protein (TIGR00299 family) protein